MSLLKFIQAAFSVAFIHQVLKYIRRSSLKMGSSTFSAPLTMGQVVFSGRLVSMTVWFVTRKASAIGVEFGDSFLEVD